MVTTLTNSRAEWREETQSGLVFRIGCKESTQQSTKSDAGLMVRVTENRSHCPGATRKTS